MSHPSRSDSSSPSRSSDRPPAHQSPRHRRELLAAVGIATASALFPTAVSAQDEGDGAGDGDAGGEENGDAEAEENGAPEDEENGEAEENGEDEENGEAEEGGGTETVTVGPGGENVFEPESLSIQPGTTVQFVWDSDNHNVNPTEQPDDADWEGHEPIEDAGFEFESTFDVEGEYEYVCDPHVGVGMIGEISVSADAEATAGNGEAAQTVPDAAMTLLIATTLSLVAVLSLSYAFLKFGDSNPQ